MEERKIGFKPSDNVDYEKVFNHDYSTGRVHVGNAVWHEKSRSWLLKWFWPFRIFHRLLWRYRRWRWGNTPHAGPEGMGELP